MKADEKFNKLTPYFEGVVISDLSILSSDDLIEMAAPHDKPLMKIFCVKFLKDHFEVKPTIYEKPNSPLAKKEESTVITEDGNYRGRLISSAYGGVAKNLNKLTVADLKGVKLSKDKKLDLSHNNLLDVDLVNLEEIIFTCKPRVLDLSMNRIHGYELLSRPQFDRAFWNILSYVQNYFVIVGNPLASVDRLDLFSTFKEEHFKKLIWIPQSWIKGESWHAMVDKSFWDIIKDAHDEYYKNE